MENFAQNKDVEYAGIPQWNSRPTALASFVSHGFLTESLVQYVEPGLSINPLLRPLKSLNLHEKNQKMFVNVE